jgi:hypothetical protein
MCGDQLHLRTSLPAAQQGLAGKVLGGWQMTGVTQFQTGTPITIGTGDDFPGIGSADTKPWNVSGDPFISRGSRAFSEAPADGNFWFRRHHATAVRCSRCRRLAPSATRTATSCIHNPGFQNWNLAGFKEFASPRPPRQFRAEFFNFPNHPNWGGAADQPAQRQLR